MTVPPLLQAPTEPWLLEWVGAPAKAYNFAFAAARHGIVSRVLRGSKMTRLQAAYDEVGAVLQFPDYFGENLDALDECLTDLMWLPGEAYVIMVTDAVKLLKRDSDHNFAMIVQVFAEAGPQWATPVERGEWWDRPARPFHVVFQVEADSREKLHARFDAAEAKLARWETWCPSDT